MNTLYPVTLLYDASCLVCALEMDHLRSRDTGGLLRFVDISAPGFDPAPYGATIEQLDAELHAVRADGQVVKGVPALRLAYEAVGLGWVVRPTDWAPLRGVADVAYRLFARHRRTISRVAAPLIDGVRSARAKRLVRRMGECRSGACAASSSAVRGEGG